MSDFHLVVVDDLEEVRRLLGDSPGLKPIGLREVVRGRDALRTLDAVLERCGASSDATVTILSDTTPKRYGQVDVLDVALETLLEWSVEVVRVAPEQGNAIVIADEQTVAATMSRVRATAPRALVTVGSGTISDIGKVVADELLIPHVIVQTAASVNGFADDQSVLLKHGVKRTTQSQWPSALIIDTWVVAEAPSAMTRSGLGDELSMFTAGADWYLGNAIGYDTSFSSAITSLMRREVDDLLSRAGDVGRGDQRAVGLLASSLTVSGLSMGVANRTSPSSGTEHLVSHLLEMQADALSIRGASHGSQVGAANVFAALVWERVRRHLMGQRPKVTLDHLASKDDVLSAFSHLDPTGAMAEECWRDYEVKARWIREHLNDIAAVVTSWPTHDRAVGELLKPVEVIASALRRAQAPIAFSQLDPAPRPEVARWAAANCHRIRRRFTVIDLAELLGLWGEGDVIDALTEHQGYVR